MNSGYPRKSLGQHWLNSEAALQAMCDAGDLNPNDTVVEIGPGKGALTELLVKKVNRVIAVELDKDLVAELPSRVQAENLEVVETDILSYNFSELPKDYKVVANIPYYLTNKLIRTLLETPNSPARTTLLIQKEVAERIAAGPGDMSILSVSVEFYCEVTLGQIVPAEDFFPEPEVDSQIITLMRRAAPLFDVDTKQFFRLIKAGFGEKRKKLINSLSGGLGIEKNKVADMIVRKCGLSENVRAQELSMHDWRNIYQEFFDL